MSLGFVGMTVYGFKITAEVYDPDGDRQGIMFVDDVGTTWVLYRDSSEGLLHSSYFKGDGAFKPPNDWNQLGFADEDGWHEVGPGTDYPDREPMGFISQGQEQAPPFEGYVPLPPDQPIGEVLGGPPKTFNPPGEDLSDKKLSDFQQKTYVPPGDVQPDPQNGPFIKHLGRARPDTDQSTPPPSGGAGGSEAEQTQEVQQRAEELERYEQAQGEPQDPPAGGGAEPGIPGLGVPYRDFIPTFPMVQDPDTGQWRNAEPGEIPGAEEGEADQTPPGDTEDRGSQAQEMSPLQFGNTGNFQNAPAEPPVAEQPAPAPPPPYDPATGMPQPDGDGDGIPNEYGDGPDLDGNGIPDEVGINPDSLQPGYPNQSASVDWGGVGVSDPSVVPPSDVTTTGAEAMPEGYGDGSALGTNWVPEETGIDPYVPPEEAPLEEEAPVAEEEDPSTLGSF